MASKQNDTMALSEEQLDGVAGGIIPQPSLRPVGSRMDVSYVSISPVPVPTTRPNPRVSLGCGPFPSPYLGCGPLPSPYPGL